MKIVWLYGLAGAGKSTLAAELAKTYDATVVDSDVFRFAWPTLGWSEESKRERATRLLQVALAQPGNVVVAACITPYRESRRAAKRAGALLVHVDTSVEECARRKPDVYERAEGLAGKDAPFEVGADYAVLGATEPKYNAMAIAHAAGWV